MLSSAAAALDQRDIAALISLRPSVLKVEASDVRGNVGIGTGVAVAPGVIATACHFTAHATSVRVVVNSERMQARHQRAQMARDLCLLDVPGASDVKPVPLREGPLQTGEELVALGYILGAAPRVSNGIVLRLHDFDGGKVIQSTTPFTSGASGGGLFDREGRLVGLMAFRFRSGTDNQFSVPVSWIREGLADTPEGDIAPLKGQPFWSRAGDELPAFLRLQQLEAESRWADLETLARQRIAQSPDDAAAWHALGVARAASGAPETALDAFVHADMLDQGNPVFLTDLALAQLRARDEAAYRTTRARLLRVSPAAAASLDARSHRCDVEQEHQC